MLSHHATTRQQRHQNLVNDAVLERKGKKTGKENLPENNPGRCMHSENIHKKINKKNTYKLSQIQVSTAIHEHVHTHCFMYRISTALTNNKLLKIFSKISNMCSFPFCTYTSAKKTAGRERWGGEEEGGKESMRAKAELAAGEIEWVSKKQTVWEREKTPSWLCYKLLPLATALAQPVSHWPAHNPMYGS